MSAEDRREYRPVLLLDMDGPLADFDRHGWEVCQDRGWSFDVPDHEHQTARYFTDHMPNKHERRWARELIESSGWFDSLPPTPGAIDGARELIEAGFDVWVCTKPLEANPTCRDDKGRWLRRHIPELEHKLILTPDKSMVVGAILLDDAPKMEWLPRSTWKPVIFDAPFNGLQSEWGGLIRFRWGDPLSYLWNVVEGGWSW